MNSEDHVPEVYVACEQCGGEGSIEVWDTASRWSTDPPCARAMTCGACNGAGGMICEAGQL